MSLEQPFTNLDYTVFQVYACGMYAQGVFSI